MIPASFIFKTKINNEAFMILEGTINRVDFIVDERKNSRNSSTSYYVSIDINEFPDFTYFTKDNFYLSSSDIKRVSDSFTIGDSIKMTVLKASYINKISKTIPQFPSNSKNRGERMIKRNYKYIEVFGYKKGNQEILPFDKYFKKINSPAGFFSYFFFCISMGMVLIGILVTYKILKKAKKGYL